MNSLPISPYYPLDYELNGLYYLGDLLRFRNQFNPNFYNRPIIRNPFPYEMKEEKGEKITLPLINMGKPLHNNYDDCASCNQSLGTRNSKLPSIKSDIKKNSIASSQSKKEEEKEEKKEEEKKEEEKKEEEKKEEEKKEEEKKEKKKIPPPKKVIRIKRGWWKLLKDFVLVYNFMSTCEKYINFVPIRNDNIENRKNSIEKEIKILKKWILSFEKPFLNEFKNYENMKLKIKEEDSEEKINKKSEIIMKIIKIYMENLIGNTKNVPLNIKKILYSFIEENGYYPKKYLSIFQFNRLDFNLYGGTRKMNNEKGGLILSFLLICGITVQQILLHLHEIINGFNNYNNVISNCKYIGTLLHYLTKETFSENPKKKNDIISLLNYYRNYHLYENKILEQNDIFEDISYNDDKDQYNKFLLNKWKVDNFLDNNPNFVETYKVFISKWAIKLSKLIRKEFNQKKTKKKKKLYLKNDS